MILSKLSLKDIEHIIETYSLSEYEWKEISKYGDLSEDFIRKYQHKLNWLVLSLNNVINLSDEFCEEFDNKLHVYNEVWKVNGKPHRTLGAAIIFNDTHTIEYWYRGKYLENIHSMEEYRHWLNLRAFA